MRVASLRDYRFERLPFSELRVMINRHVAIGVPVVLDGTIVGAVGASAGTVEQDIAVAEAAIAALDHVAPSSDDRLRHE